MKKLAKSKLEKINSLEPQLNEEKVTSTQPHQNLDKANEELRRLRKEKEMNDRSCLEAFKGLKSLGCCIMRANRG